MHRLRDLLLPSLLGAARTARALVSGLPAYQVALWPDGWDLEPDGAVAVRDTNAMAEARRWYSLAERNRSRGNGQRVMALYGIFVPREIVDMAGRRFPSEQVASVAVNLVAGDWVKQRRHHLLATPADALVQRSLAWCGSRHAPGLDETDIRALMRELVATCVAEQLIPDAAYRFRIRSGEAYGVSGYRCVLEVGLEHSVRDGVADVLGAALIPWNRAVVRAGIPTPLIVLEVRARRRVT